MVMAVMTFIYRYRDQCVRLSVRLYFFSSPVPTFSSGGNAASLWEQPTTIVPGVGEDWGAVASTGEWGAEPVAAPAATAGWSA